MGALALTKLPFWRKGLNILRLAQKRIELLAYKPQYFKSKFGSEP